MTETEINLLAKSIAREMWKPVMIGATAALLAVVYLHHFGERDATDDPEGDRSNMRLHVDHETGVEYLSAPGGGLIRREFPEDNPFERFAEDE